MKNRRDTEFNLHVARHVDVIVLCSRCIKSHESGMTDQVRTTCASQPASARKACLRLPTNSGCGSHHFRSIRSMFQRRVQRQTEPRRHVVSVKALPGLHSKGSERDLRDWSV